jgi:hypothetical protein
MILQLKHWLPRRLLIIVADSSYAVLDLLSAVQDKVSFITRLRLDAALYDPAPPRQPGKRGPRRLKGARQPTLKERLNDAAIQWQAITIAKGYNQKDKQVQVATGIAIWYHKQHITFADAIAAVRSSLWKEGNYYTSTQNNDMINMPKPLFDQLTNLITRAA